MRGVRIANAGSSHSLSGFIRRSVYSPAVQKSWSRLYAENTGESSIFEKTKHLVE